ncbi:hypothetical protein WICMUC_003956 [Wickerhamomyces mucosus]|uniref:J domain-containing protein n=1 Tax=Wickerhamomyces mucosus TaxID=1378264 RepID=A0A9P8PIM6_9ASCO|nr:hypothetical protein WICMUC_003956 [Wickerhamomyces mucosus]
MGVPFPDLDPYETLKISKEASEQDIKKSYRKLCLQYHPDKLKNSDDADESKLKFEKILFAHSILNDSKKRKRYDQTGLLDEVDTEDGFDWFEYFSKVKAEINEESIAKDRKVYRNSEDEEQDIIEQFIETDGDFLILFETIPHTELSNEEENRLFSIVDRLVNDKILENYLQWKNYKSKRKQIWVKYLKSQLKSLSKEAKEAEKTKKEILKKNKGKNLDSESDLQQFIISKRKTDMDSLISKLESKYGDKKTSKRKGNDIDDDEFAKIQAKLDKNKRKK